MATLDSNSARLERLERLEHLEHEVEACRRCPRLVAWREQVGEERRRSFAQETYWARPVPGFGDPRAHLVVVGLAPAAHGGNRTGRMFTGDRSGEWLFGALHRAGFASQPISDGRDDGLTLTGVFVTAAVRCAPPDNKPTTEERDTCLPYLAAELELLDAASVYVALGAFALHAIGTVFGLRPRPKFAHLAEFDIDGRRRVISSYHPSQRNTFTKMLTTEMFDAVFERAKALGAGPEY
ncbi:MAG: uracil-DNA glycosylase [Acidimicrobiales bacterium]